MFVVQGDWFGQLAAGVGEISVVVG